MLAALEAGHFQQVVVLEVVDEAHPHLFYSQQLTDFQVLPVNFPMVMKGHPELEAMELLVFLYLAVLLPSCWHRSPGAAELVQAGSTWRQQLLPIALVWWQVPFLAYDELVSAVLVF